MNFLTMKLDEEPPICRRCGRKSRLVCKMLDPKTGETARMFICECDELIWTASDLHDDRHPETSSTW